MHFQKNLLHNKRVLTPTPPKFSARNKNEHTPPLRHYVIFERPQKCHTNILRPNKSNTIFAELKSSGSSACECGACSIGQIHIGSSMLGHLATMLDDLKIIVRLILG